MEDKKKQSKQSSVIPSDTPMVRNPNRPMGTRPNTGKDPFNYGKLPPQAVEVEELVLGALMLEKDAINQAIEILNDKMFYKDAHQHIFKAIYELFADSSTIDMATVSNKLRSMGKLDEAGGPYYIAGLTTKVASAANIEFHARIIAEKFIQRELIRVSSEIIGDAFDETKDVFKLLDRAENNLFQIAEQNLHRSASDMTSIVKDAILQIEEAAKKEGNISGIPSGFYDIDNITAGWQPSDLIILAARPGMGKTAFALTVARNIAVDYQRAVAVFSLEMSAAQLVTRLLAAEAQIDAANLKKGTLSSRDWESLHAASNKLVKARLFIDDTPALSLFELRAKCRRLKAQHDIQMIFIDYLQLMTAKTDKGNREQEISTISRGLKALAKELKVPIMTLSQLNRSVETRGGSKKPQLSDLRESGAIEQDADMVCFIYRPDYYGLNEGEEGEEFGENYAEFIIAKHRNGSLEDVKVQFIKRFARFENFAVHFDDQALLSQEGFGGGGNPVSNISPNESFDEGDSITFSSHINDEVPPLPGHENPAQESGGSKTEGLDDVPF